MEIELKQHTSTEGALQIKIEASDYQPGLRKRVRHYSQRARISGFRAGQVPPHHIQKVYGKSLLLEELNELLKKYLQDYIEEHQLKTLGTPILEEADPLGDSSDAIDYCFSYRIALQPEITLTGIDKILLTQYEIETEEKDFEEFIENIQYRFGTTSHPDQVQDLDVVLSGRIQCSERKEESLNLSYAEMQPGAQGHFQGRKPGDTISVQLSTLYSPSNRPATLQKLEKQGVDLSLHYTFHLDQIDQVQKADLDEHLFKKVYGNDAPSSREEFLKKCKKHLEEQYKNESRRFLYTQIKNRVIQDLAPALPEDYLRKHFQINIPDEHKDKMDAQTIEISFNRYKEDLKWRMIQSKITEIHQISVSSEELYQEVEQLFLRQARIYSAPTDQQRLELRPFIEKYLSNSEHRSNIHAQMQEEQILKFLAQELKIKKQRTTPTLFHKMSSEYYTSIE